MAKKYIKMNNNDNYLSLGNFMRIIKELSKNKSSALQTEIFCAIFKVESVNDTTVNNYCVGIRSIGDAYKQVYLNLSRKYASNHECMKDIIINLITIMEGKLFITTSLDSINSNETIRTLSYKMYNIAKNDENVDTSFVQNLSTILNKEDYYSFIVSILFHIVLTNKQPLYEIDIKKDKIEELLNDSYVSYKGIEDYISLKLRESINYEYTLKKLAHEGNVMANYEVGSNEYLGYVMGYPRYNIAYEYLLVAHNANHAGASFLIGEMFLDGNIGNKDDKSLENAFEFFTSAKEHGSIAALNKLGLMYMHGIHPVKKNINKAKELFAQASSRNYVYSFNNLGKIAEMENNPNYIDYYMKSANLHECWACNRIGEYYRNKGDLEHAFKYYNDALQGNNKNRCYFAYYNLAKYFYINGCFELGIEKNMNTYIEYLDIASKHGLIEASIELLTYYLNNYKLNRSEADYKRILEYKNDIECNPKFNIEYKKKIESLIDEIITIDNLNI